MDCHIPSFEPSGSRWCTLHRVLREVAGDQDGGGEDEGPSAGEEEVLSVEWQVGCSDFDLIHLGQVEAGVEWVPVGCGAGSCWS